MPVSMMWALKVRRSTMSATRRGSGLIDPRSLKGRLRIGRGAFGLECPTVTRTRHRPTDRAGGLEEWGSCCDDPMKDASTPKDLPIGGGRRQRVALLGAPVLGLFGLALATAPRVGVVGRVIGIFDFLFFGFLGGIAFVRSRRADSIYVLADDGIRFEMSDFPTVPWSRVEGARIVWAVGQRFLAIDVISPEELASHRGRCARWALRLNLRRGWGAIAISERLAPGTLEELAKEINQRRLGKDVPEEVPSEPRPPIARRYMRALQRPAGLVALQGVLQLISVSTAQATGQGVRRGVFALLLIGGAILINWRPKLGVPVVVATEAVLIALILALGHYAVSVRILSLFLPVCILMSFGLQRPDDFGRTRRS